MNLDGAQLLGLATMAVIAIVVMAIALRKQPRGVWLFALALLLVGLGYLATTGTPTELARTIYGQPG